MPLAKLPLWIAMLMRNKFLVFPSIVRAGLTTGAWILVTLAAFLFNCEFSEGQGNQATLEHTNHLITEQSPYLLLHAHNPVDWYSWGTEAFEKASHEHKPVYLSIGYFTCHWCHVMERESFSNPEIADILNKYFVAIKVDREEHPEIDRLYLAYSKLSRTKSDGL